MNKIIKWGFIGCGALYLVGGIITHIWVEENFVPVKKSGKNSSPWKELFMLPKAIWILLAVFTAVGLARSLDST